MDAADTLYGVSMGGDGVSRVVSRKLAGAARKKPRPDAAALARYPAPWPKLAGAVRHRRGAGSRRPGRRSSARGFFRRLRDNMSKTRQALGAELQATMFQSLDDEAFERLEETLIYADVGAPTTATDRRAAGGARPPAAS